MFEKGEQVVLEPRPDAVKVRGRSLTMHHCDPAPARVPVGQF